LFIDRARISVKAGAGGNGSASFRREKYVPFGGPDGGDGGRGGSVYLLADPGVDTLSEYQFRRHYKAGAGGNGLGSRKHGKKGEDRVLRVPPGTIAHRIPIGDGAEEVEFLADLDEPGARVLVAQGGRGGLGNTHFATATHQAPKMAQKGEPGEEFELELELKLIADVGIAGHPNAGKSTLLARVSAARPKIADYPFTTLVPNLGVVEIDDHRFVMADIPGLIEGAHAGAGLGHEFLRHIERTKVLIQLIDGLAADPLADFRTIAAELEQFNPELAERPRLVAVNKIDVPEARAAAARLRSELSPLPLGEGEGEGASRGGGGAQHSALSTQHSFPVFAISAVTGEGVTDLLRAVWAALEEARRTAAVAPPPVDFKVFRPLPQDEFTIRREDGAYVVRGRAAERAVAMTNMENEEALTYLQKRLSRLGVTQALEEAGVKAGDTVRFGKIEMEWV
jgi:GTP-binding protein